MFGLFFRKMDIPVHRENSKQAYNALQKAYNAIDKGENVAMYPEGTIPTTAPRMKAFKNGAFKMAIDKNIPIVPITWQSCYKVINNPEKLFSPSRPATVKVVIHQPVYPKGNTDADMKQMRDEVFMLIDSALPYEFQKGTRT